MLATESRPFEQPVPPPIPFPRGYLPTLDGWRAIAILIVLLDHSPTFGIGRLSNYPFHFLGNFGVQIFFALSGILITSRLLDEEAKTGKLHLKGFYIRRITRIQPAAWAYLLAVAMLTLLHRLPEDRRAFVSALLLFRNYVHLRDGFYGWPTVHFWSLSVEEHFYLLLPAFLLFVKKGRARILLAAALADMAWYLLYLSHHGWRAEFDYFHTDLCIHTLILAASFAAFLRSPATKAHLAQLIRWWWTLPLTLGLMRPHTLRAEFLFLTPCFLILSTLLHPHTWIGRVLELAPLRFLGRISYSLYLWQELFFSGYFAPQLHTFGNMQRLWLIWPAAFLCAIASFYCIEKPFIRLGHRLARPATAGRPL